MAIDFDDPTTWSENLSAADALSLGIFALNTLKYPDASSDAQMSALDFFTEGAVEQLVALRDGGEVESFPVIDGLPLRISFVPDAIREHFEGDEEYGDKVAALSNDELGRVGAAALSDDVLYEEFHKALAAVLDNTEVT